MQGQRDKQRQRQREEHEKISMETLEIWGEKTLKYQRESFYGGSRWESQHMQPFAVETVLRITDIHIQEGHIIIYYNK